MMQRLLAAFAAAVGAGLLVALLSGMVFEPFATVGRWGAVNGGLAAGIVFLAVLSRGGRWLGILARWLLVAVLGVAAYALSWWTVATGTPLWSLEGAWLWPLTVAALAASVLAGRWAWRGGSAERTQP